jgi:putative oxidoreductase
MHIIELVGRIFLSAIFLLAGVGKIFNFESTTEYMESFNVPGYLITPAIIIEILFPILIIIGYRTKLSAIILSLFAILLAIIFHNDFSNQMQLMSFLKNFAIAGGFMIIFVYGSNKISLDHFLKSKQDTIKNL